MITWANVVSSEQERVYSVKAFESSTNVCFYNLALRVYAVCTVSSHYQAVSGYQVAPLLFLLVLWHRAVATHHQIS